MKFLAGRILDTPHLKKQLKSKYKLFQPEQIVIFFQIKINRLI